MRRSWRLCVPLAVALALCAAGPASAYRFAGRTWPGHTITYYDAAPASARAVRSAVYAWNTSGADIRFVATSRQLAKLVIRPIDLSSVNGHQELGVASEGWIAPNVITPNPARGGTIHGDNVWLVPPSQIAGEPMYQQVQTAAHELGHILGLGHETRGCADMNPVALVHCPAPTRWQERCRALEPDDIQGAIALYGGHMKANLGPEFCDIAPLPSAPTHLSAATPGSREVRLSWINPGGITLGTQASIAQLRGHPSVESYVAAGVQGPCPAAGAHGTSGTEQDTSASSPVTATIFVTTPGQWCFTVAIGDFFGRFGAPAHLIVSVPG